MKKVFLFSLISLIVLFVGSGYLAAQPSQGQSTHNLLIQVNIAEWYDLSIGETAITFDDQAPPVSATPGTVSIAANENSVSVRVFAILVPGNSLQLTVNAPNDLTKGTGTDIGIEAISWTATGDGYVAGIMSKTTNVTAGSWSGAVFHWHPGTFDYLFARDYTTQEPGTYSATVTYTLSST